MLTITLMMPRWLYTDKRPPNHVEMMHTAHFSGDELELLPETLQQRLYALLDEARTAVAAQDANVWRIGEIRIRWRVGRARTPLEIASISSTNEVLRDGRNVNEDGPMEPI
jgi:hypothetical protein